jgi:hypothetical protein
MLRRRICSSKLFFSPFSLRIYVYLNAGKLVISLHYTYIVKFFTYIATWDTS